MRLLASLGGKGNINHLMQYCSLCANTFKITDILQYLSYKGAITNLKCQQLASGEGGGGGGGGVVVVPFYL